MTYGLDRGLFVENGPAVQAAKALSRRSSSSFLAWRQLDASGRIALVEAALGTAANENHPDGYPVAL